MKRYLFAFTALVVLTILPLAYTNLLQARPRVSFPQLVDELEQVSLCPNGWRIRDSDFQFDDTWMQRLGLHYYKAAELVTPEGNELTALIMLSENGEQLYHTPAVCYEAHGCDVIGETVDIELLDTGKTGSSMGTVTAVEVRFDNFTEAEKHTAAHTYWVSPTWKSPPQSRILNQIGHEPYLLKTQLLIRRHSPRDNGTHQILSEYLAFLAEQLRDLQQPRVPI